MLKNPLKIKVCGMREIDNIAAVAALDIDYMGFIFYPGSKRYVTQSVSTAGSLIRTGVFVNDTIPNIQQKTREYGLQAIQLHGDEAAEFCRQIGDPSLELIKAFGIDPSFQWEQLAPYLDVVDLFLFDTKSSSYGGTGQTFDWQKLKSYPYDKPYFLSGGLGPDNITEAKNFDDDRLYGLDLNSKFESSPGLKNISTLTQALKLLKDE